MMHTQVHRSVGPRDVGRISREKATEIAKAIRSDRDLAELRRLGIGLDMASVKVMAQAYGMDANFTAPLSTPSVGAPVQFLQEFLPGYIWYMTAARLADEIMGVKTAGQPEDEQVVFGIMERTGNPTQYADLANVPLSSYNQNFETRTVVRFEEGLQVGRLEEMRASRMKISAGEEKRQAAFNALEIIRNQVGFFGYNNGANRTYGLLNDPNLPAYVNVPNGASGSAQWSSKTANEIIADILSSMASLQLAAQGLVDPQKTPITLAVALSKYQYLNVPSQLTNYSVMSWLKDNYPNVRVLAVPEFENANGGDDVFYLYAENLADSGTDGGEAVIQVVPTKFMTVGVEQRAKSYVEDYANATAGAIVKRPFLFIRRSGI